MYQQLSNVAYVLAFAVVKVRATVANAWWTAMADQARLVSARGALYARPRSEVARETRSSLHPTVGTSRTSAQMQVGLEVSPYG